MATWTDPPYIYLEVDENNGELLVIYWIEGEILKYLSEKLNFNISIIAPHNNERGHITDPTNATGALAMVCIGTFFSLIEI